MHIARCLYVAMCVCGMYRAMYMYAIVCMCIYVFILVCVCIYVHICTFTPGKASVLNTVNDTGSGMLTR